jgi:hypothetical protein
VCSRQRCSCWRSCTSTDRGQWNTSGCNEFNGSLSGVLL